MTEYLELMLLVALVVSITGLLITGVIHLAVRVASPRPKGQQPGRRGQRSRTPDAHTPKHQPREGRMTKRHRHARMKPHPPTEGSGHMIVYNELVAITAGAGLLGFAAFLATWSATNASTARAGPASSASPECCCWSWGCTPL